MSDSLRPHESQHARPLCPSPTPRVHSDSRHRVSDAIQPSHPLSSPSPPAPNPSQHQSLCQWVTSSHEPFSATLVGKVSISIPFVEAEVLQKHTQQVTNQTQSKCFFHSFKVHGRCSRSMSDSQVASSPADYSWGHLALTSSNYCFQACCVCDIPSSKKLEGRRSMRCARGFMV